MRLRLWLGRASLGGLVAALGLVTDGCGELSKKPANVASDAGAGGEGVAAGGSSLMGGSPAGGSPASDDAVIPCTSDGVCTDAGRLCDPLRSVCVQCRDTADCGSEQLCLFSECVDYTRCENSRDCPADSVCDEPSGVCVECVADGDCTDGGICAAGRCRAACESDKTCVALGQLCDEGNGYCLDCVKDGDCGNGGYCELGQCWPSVCAEGARLCLGDELLTCDVGGRGYTSVVCAVGCSDAAGGHCLDEGSGGAGSGGAGGEAGCGDTTSDPQNCGACGYACVHGRECVAGRCTPAWQPLGSVNVPSARTRHAAGFVDGKYVVLGGSPTTLGVGLATTAGYDVEADVWSALASLNGARCSHEAVSTGTDILTFGGLTDCGDGGTTGPALERFTPNNAAGAWANINTAGAPGARYDFAATWTGTALLVYGGATNQLPAVATGGLFSSVGSSWSDASCSLQGCERGGTFSAFTDGNVVRLWGGAFGNAPAGLSYNLGDMAWTSWQVPANTAEHLAKRFADDGRRIYFLKATNVVSIFDRESGSWLPSDTAAMPNGFCTEAATAWTGSELVAWSGDCGAGPTTIGGRYQPPAP
jgi:hypothetical protein